MSHPPVLCRSPRSIERDGAREVQKAFSSCTRRLHTDSTYPRFSETEWKYGNGPKNLTRSASPITGLQKSTRRDVILNCQPATGTQVFPHSQRTTVTRKMPK